MTKPIKKLTFILVAVLIITIIKIATDDNKADYSLTSCVEGTECVPKSIDVKNASFMGDLFDTSLWPPRWKCGTWSSFHGWLYILSDLTIWLAYFTIPGLMAIFLYRRKAVLPFKNVQLLFIAFILACGSTHLIDAIIFWVPLYKLSALLRFITAVVSIGTALALIKVMPQVLSYKSPEELTAIINEQTIELRNEVEEKESARSEARYLLENLPILTFVANPNGQIFDYNKQWQLYTGYDPYLSNNWSEILHPEDATTYDEIWEKCLISSEECEVEVRVLSKEGYYEWFLAKIIAIYTADKKRDLIKWIGAFTNIHQQKMIESRKDTFLNIASHELKTPLTGVKACLQLQQEAIANKDFDMTANLGEKALKNAARLEQLIQELLDISRIQSGVLYLSVNKFNFRLLIDDVLEIFRLSSTHKIQIVSNEDIEVCADRNRVEQILNNFLSNAIKYSPKADTIELNTFVQSGQLHVEVTDFGIGISSEDQLKLFSQFYRTEEAAKNANGLGMGLYISQEIAKIHNGVIKVSSTVGEGSTFTLILPVGIDEAGDCI